MNPATLNIARTVVSFTCGFGAAKCVGGIITSNVAQTTILDKVLVTAGRFALGGITSQIVQASTEQQFDQAVEMVKKLNQAAQENAAKQ